MAKKANGSITRKDAVRQALSTLGEEASRADIQKFVKDKHGYDMTPDHISNAKSELRKETGAKKPMVAKQPPAQKPHVHKPAATSQAGGIDLKDIETVKDLVERVGAASLKRLIDVMAR